LGFTNAFAGKKVARTEESAVGAEIEVHSEEEDTTLIETEDGDASIQDEDTAMDQEDAPAQSPAVGADTRATFSFTMDAPTVDDLPDYESLDGHQETEHDCAPTEDATLTNFFHSPVKAAIARTIQSPAKIEYPQLPHSHDRAAEVEITVEVVTEEVHQVAEGSPIREELSKVHYTTVRSEHLDQVEEVVAQAIEETAATVPEITYPTLPSADMESPDLTPTLDENMDHLEDETVELSEILLGTPVEGELQGLDHGAEDISSSPEADDADEEFTEASLQLNILREYQEALRANRVTPTAAEELQPEVESSDQNVPHESQTENTTNDDAGTEEMGSLETPQSPAAASDAAQPQSSSQSDDVDMAEAPTADIADGLVLSFTPAKPASASPAPRKLHSPPPSPRLESGPDDATMTLAIDDDTAILKDFLTRAAASKAEKAAVTTHRRESLQNRRDSDVIRHALASPRKVLEEKDPNSPNKFDNELTLDLSQTLTLSMPNEVLDSPILGATPSAGTEEEEKKSGGSRRSSRTKKSRLPAPTPTGPSPAPKIAIRRNEIVVLKKDDAKLLSDVTRSNTRKNKQGAFGVTVRLMKICLESGNLPPLDDDDVVKELVVGKNVRWDETLAYYQENPETVAEAESLATPDELGMDDEVVVKKKEKKEKTSKTSTPKIRRVRGLGSTNGTPGKGLLAPSSLLPDAVQDERETVPAPKPKAKKTKMPVASSSSINDSLSSSISTMDTKLPTLDVAPVGVTPGTQRKSRLAAPRKVVLPSSTPGEGKENAQKPASKIGMLPVPKVMLPPSTAAVVGGGSAMDSGLPRRRGRKY
jgi:hypothetical protein